MLHSKRSEGMPFEMNVIDKHKVISIDYLKYI